MKELAEKALELRKRICEIRETEYICQRARTVFEISETDSKTLDLCNKILKKYLTNKI